MSAPSMSDRVATARDLLEDWPEEEYETLPAGCQAAVQEAIEFLVSVERELPTGEQDGEGKK